MTLDELDGAAVAPANQKVIFENDQVRVLETTIAAGEVRPLHTHLAPTVMSVLPGRISSGATNTERRCSIPERTPTSFS